MLTYKVTKTDEGFRAEAVEFITKIYGQPDPLSKLLATGVTEKAAYDSLSIAARVYHGNELEPFHEPEVKA